MVRIQSSIRKIVPFLLASALSCLGQESIPHFLPGDPLWKVPETASAQQAVLVGVDNLYDFAVNSAQYKRHPDTLSFGINTLGEVPDSSWYTNRHASKSMSPDEIRRGPRTHGAPVPPFTVVAAKTEGVTPGFRIRDSRGLIYFIKVDPPSNPEMSTAADVIGALFFYAAGYNVPENYIVNAKRDQFQLSSKATLTSAGKKHSLKQDDLDKMLRHLPTNQNSEIRVMASLALEGKIIGPFRYTGTRSDDPNDLVPHEQRRDLRGLAVLCAWLNHTDAKADNTMDTVVGKGADARVQHNLLDFGAAFGSDSDIAKDPRHGQEFFLPTSKTQLHKVYTLGLLPDDWERVHYSHDLPAAGNFTEIAFQPATWNPNYPNQAFLRMTPEDAYWGAKQVMAFSDEDIQAIVEEGKFSDPRVTKYVITVLEQRRVAVGKYWFSVILPLEHFRIEDGAIRYDDLAQHYNLDGGERQLHFTWFHWQNEVSKQGAVIKESTATTVPAELSNVPEGSFIGCRIKNKSNGPAVTVYFHNERGEWRLVGISRSVASR